MKGTKRRFRPKLRAPEPIGGVLGRAGEDRFAPSRDPVAPHVWAAAVGPRIAERTRPLALEDGTLMVRAATAVWASELSLLSDALLARLRAAGVKVRALRFRVGPIDPPERPAAIRRARVPPPVALGADLTRDIAGVADDELREAIAAAARTSLAWRAHEDEGATLTSAPRAARAPRDAGTGSDPPGQTGAASRGAAPGTRGDE